jgi:hypothetical protein
LKRELDHLQVTVRSPKETVLCLSNQAGPAHENCHASAAVVRTLSVTLPRVEVSLDVQRLPAAGATTSQPRVIEESYSAHELAFTMEGVGGTTAELSVRNNSAQPQRKGTVTFSVDGADLNGDKLKVIFPKGSGFVSQGIRISWP